MIRITPTISLVAASMLVSACQQRPDMSAAHASPTQGTAYGSRVASVPNGQSHPIPGWAVGIDSYQ